MEDKKKILLVDDEESITRTLKLFLDRRGGYKVRTENRGSQTVQVARDFRPDLIVLDIVMPDADGGAIAQDLSEDPELKSVPIVFLTAIIKEKEIGGGGHTYLAKPVEPDVLIGHIQERLGVQPVSSSR
jgi:DNA-binding response OmpR family regulator